MVVLTNWKGNTGVFWCWQTAVILQRDSTHFEPVALLSTKQQGRCLVLGTSSCAVERTCILYAPILRRPGCRTLNLPNGHLTYGATCTGTMGLSLPPMMRSFGSSWPSSGLKWATKSVLRHILKVSWATSRRSKYWSTSSLELHLDNGTPTS